MKTKLDLSTLKSLGEFAIAAFRAQQSPGSLAHDSGLRAALGNSENIPADGGFLVPAQTSDILIRSIMNQTDLAQLCTRIPVTVGSRANFPAIDERSRANGSRWGGVSSAWGTEASTIATSKPKFRSLELNLNRLTAATFTTEENLQDSTLMGALVETVLTEEAAFQLDLGILSGSGTGQPLGLLNSPGLVTAAADGSQASGTISTSNIQNIFKRMLPSSRKTAVWLVSSDIEEALYTLVGESGTLPSIFTSGDSLAPFGRLMNRPIVPCEQCPTIGTKGDIVFVDPQSYIIAERPPNVALSIHVAFLTGEPCFRLIARCDGQPALATPVTPFNGGPTQSTHVALAARP